MDPGLVRVDGQGAFAPLPGLAHLTFRIQRGGKQPQQLCVVRVTLQSGTRRLGRFLVAVEIEENPYLLGGTLGH
ncbi:hypothetical protein BHQ19_20090 [Mycolicibacterium porcinum]|nr:hypothetical protein BHQ19_20090 [Mycolicibacterium porcinum]